MRSEHLPPQLKSTEAKKKNSHFFQCTYLGSWLCTELLEENQWLQDFLLEIEMCVYTHTYKYACGWTQAHILDVCKASQLGVFI